MFAFAFNRLDSIQMGRLPFQARLSLSMTDAVIAVTSSDRDRFAGILTYAMWSVVGAHALLLLAVRPSPIGVSRFLTAAIPILAGAACIWRARRLPARERPIWL
jgi:hypothetical protein